MALKPLQYQSLKVVLEHMDANLRFQLSGQIPSIRTVERVVPLKIRLLSFGLGRMSINKIEYELRIHRDSHSKELPECIKEANAVGGLNYDIDQWGFRDFSGLDHMTPGDVIVENTSVMNSILREQNEQAGRILNVHTFIKAEEGRMKFYQTMLESTENGTKPTAMQDQVGFFKRRIAACQEMLTPYYLLRNNTLPEYDNWIQLRMTTEENMTIERVKYSRKLYEAEKYFYTFLFGGRKSSINVNLLEINLDHLTLRFPIGLKFKIKNLSVPNKHLLENNSFISIIETQSLPIRSLTIGVLFGNFDFPIAKTAKQLVIEGVSDHGFDLHSLTNKLVVFKRCQFSLDVYRRLVRNWLDTDREVGTVYEFVGRELHIAGRLMETIRTEINETIVGERHISIPMKSKSHLRISHRSVKSSIMGYRNQFLKMEVF